MFPRHAPYVLLRPLSLALLLLSGGGPAAWAQGVVTGHARVLDGGVPLPEVRVALVRADSLPPAAEARTDHTGRFTLRDVPAGRWQLEAVYREQELTYTLTAPVEVTDARPLVLTIEMPAALHEWRAQHAETPAALKGVRTITGYMGEGRVRDARGRPLPGTQGRLHEARTGLLAGTVTAGGRPLPEARLLLAGIDRAAVTDARGRFEVDALPPGRYTLTVVHGADTLATSRLEIRPGLNAVDLSLERRR